MTHKFLINEDDATFDDQAEPDSVDFEILLLGYQGTGIKSGCAVTESASPGMKVDVASGTGFLAWAEVSVSASVDLTVTAADGSNPRVDLVSINSGGTAVVTAGTAAVQPVAPSIPATSMPIAFLYVPTSDTTITDNQINDKRVIIKAGSSPSPMYAENNGEAVTVSGSTWAWKGSCIVPYFATSIWGAVFIGTVVNGGTYQGAVVTESGGTVATIDKSDTTVADSIDAETVNGRVMVLFDPPIALTAGTTYFLLMGRTDAGDSHPLPVQYPSPRYSFPFASVGTNASLRIAEANPAVDDTINFFAASSTRIGCLFTLD